MIINGLFDLLITQRDLLLCEAPGSYYYWNDGMTVWKHWVVSALFLTKGSWNLLKKACSEASDKTSLSILSTWLVGNNSLHISSWTWCWCWFHSFGTVNYVHTWFLVPQEWRTLVLWCGSDYFCLLTTASHKKSSELLVLEVLANYIWWICDNLVFWELGLFWHLRRTSYFSLCSRVVKMRFMSAFKYAGSCFFCVMKA